jgi:hypothetical protein
MNTLPYLFKLLEMLQLPDDWHGLQARPVGLFRAFRSYFRSHPMWWLWITNHSLTFLFPLPWGGAATCDLTQRVEHCAGSGAGRLSGSQVSGFRVAGADPPCIRLRRVLCLVNAHEAVTAPVTCGFFCPPAGCVANTRPPSGASRRLRAVTRHPAPSCCFTKAKHPAPEGGALSQEVKMKPRNTRGQGRSPLPATLGPPEDGAKPASPPVLITQRKLRGETVLPPLAWPAGAQAA